MYLSNDSVLQGNHFDVKNNMFYKKRITWPVGSAKIKRYFRALRKPHIANKRFWGLGRRFSENLKQDV